MKFFDEPQVLIDGTSLVERFVEYVKIDTTSDESSKSSPSTENQLVLAEKLVSELKQMGLDDAAVNRGGYVTATLPSNRDTSPVVGLIAHLDTSPAAPGADVKPVFHERYDGSPIRLEGGVVIDPEDNPELERCAGDTIITSDGTTLLGADDKAGVAVIMSVMEYLGQNPDIPRPTIRVGFTPDEEIGRGATAFPIEEFGAEVAFTLDGAFKGEINIETFEADSAVVTVTGVSTHPGSAKGKMVNALRHMAKLIGRLPVDSSPEQTDGRQGFMHPYECKGDASECSCQLILRDFEREGLASLGRQLRSIAESVEQEEPRLEVEVKIEHSYPNMYRYLKDRPEIVERLERAVRLAGIEPVLTPIRGGTDGATLTRRGLPCPNIFAGGMNFHGPTEWISTRSMGLAACSVINLMMLYAGEESAT